MVLGRVQGEVAEQFTILAQHTDVEVADQDNDPSGLVRSTDPYVMQPRPVAAGECPGLVDLPCGTREWGVIECFCGSGAALALAGSCIEQADRLGFGEDHGCLETT